MYFTDVLFIVLVMQADITVFILSTKTSSRLHSTPLRSKFVEFYDIELN